MTPPRPFRCPRCDCRWTISAAVKAGTLRATKRGRDWHITPAAVEQYRATSLGKPGRKAR